MLRFITLLLLLLSTAGAFAQPAGPELAVRVAGEDLRIGVAASTGPAAQDPLISPLNWSFPFAAPPFSTNTPIQPVFSAPEMESTVGATVHLLLAERFYVEGGAYDLVGPAMQRAFGKSYAPNIDRSFSPYARAGYAWHGEGAAAHVGMAYLSTNFNPQQGVFSVNGLLGRNHYADMVIDASVQLRGNGRHEFALYGAFIREQQRLGGLFARGISTAPSGVLNQLHTNVAYLFERTWRLALGMQTTWGPANPALYRPGAIGGSRNGKPDSTAFIIEANWRPFGKAAPEGSLLSTVKFGIQYVAYTKFNGGGPNYDGFRRDASANNTAYGFLQMQF